MIDKLPRWALVYGTLGFMLIMGFVGRLAYADIYATKQESAETKLRVEILEKNFEKRFDRLDDKIDRIGERLGVKA